MILLLVIALYFVGNWYSSGPVTVSVKDSGAPVAAGTPERVKRKPPVRQKADTPVIPPFRSQDPTLRSELMAYSESMKYTGGERNIFAPPGYVAEVIMPTGPETPGTATPPFVPPTPPKPTIPLRFYGFTSTAAGLKRVFFTDADGQDIFIGQEGDLINKRYQIVKIKKESVDVFDVINHFSQNFPMPTALSKNAFN